MGEAVETGILLDSEHRPRFPLSAAVIALLLMFAGLAARLLIKDFFQTFNEVSSYAVWSIPLAIAVMAAFYFMDYTVFTKFPKIAYISYLCVLVAITLIRSEGEHGWYYSNIASRTFFFGALLLAPLTCGFVWSMRGKGFGGFALTCILMVVPAAAFALWIPCLSSAIMIGLSSLAVMTFAVKNNFFNVKKKSAYLFMYIPAVIAAAGLIIVNFDLLNYFKVVYTQDILIGDTANANPFIDDTALFIFHGCRLFGESTTPFYGIPMPEGNHLIAAIIIRFGWAAGIALTLVLLSLPVIVLIKTKQIKNIFGRMVSFSIGIVFLFEVVSYILANYGITILMESVIVPPFMTASLMNAVSSAALLGLFMSAYRTKDIFPERKINAAPLSHS